MDSMNSQYHDQLFSDLPDAKKARDYLEKRGFSENEIREFGFGFATGREIWNGMREEGWKEQDLLACGLVSKRDENRLKPVFFSRITIPIRDDEGKLIAFGARSIIDDHDKKIPKYINSPQSPLFAKQDTLFGLDSARDAIVREKNVIVVEGYMDVIALRKAGIYNVVATMGTALSENHVEKLKRLTPDVTFSFDGDKAGKLADVRAREITKSHVGILSFSVPEKDVDEYLKGHSRDDLLGIKNDRVSVPAEILSKKIEKTFREAPESVSILD
jgi:DNA primase